MKKYSFSSMNDFEFRQALEQRDPELLNGIIRFLEDDPYAFRTGYAKQRYWRYVGRFDLSPQQVSRLEIAALQYLERPPSREFRPMCVTMSRIATNRFWQIVKGRLNSTSTVTRLSAACLYTYSAGTQNGGENLAMMWQFRSYVTYVPLPKTWDKQDLFEWAMSRRTPPIRMQTEYDLLDLVKKPLLWHDGGTIFTEPDQSDLPIVSTHHMQFEHEFARLSIRDSNQKVAFQMLNGILGTAFLNIFTEIAWLYGLYLLYRVDDAGAVSVVKRFLYLYDLFGLNAKYHHTVMRACFKILRHYNTPDAMAMLVNYDAVQQGLPKQYNISPGWLGIYE